MAGQKRDTPLAKLKRTLTSVLPVKKNRKGACVKCGECCKLPTVCPFLKFRRDGKSYCSVYSLRPLNCRKYPRTKTELVTKETCGFKFN